MQLSLSFVTKTLWKALFKVIESSKSGSVLATVKHRAGYDIFSTLMNFILDYAPLNLTIVIKTFQRCRAGFHYLRPDKVKVVLAKCCDGSNKRFYCIQPPYNTNRLITDKYACI